MKPLRLLYTLLPLAGWCPSVLGVETPAAITFFENKVRPLLVAKCYECHSSEAGKSKGGLLLDSRAGLLKGGDTGPGLDSESPEKSLFLAAIRRETSELQMPPKDPLTDAEVAILEQWVRMGAPDPRTGALPSNPMEGRLVQAKTHWAFQSLQAPPVPEVRTNNWVKVPLDAFVLAGLEARGLNPSPPADPRTLLRRLYFDTTGLLPTPEELESFAANPDEAAYAAAVDRQLASPHFGERWGRHWLDLARYADSSGLHNDLDRPHAWRYRDYVIKSFNEDKPLARFVAEQIAGDEVEFASEDTLVATGFCRNGPTNEDNMGNKAEQARLDELDDVISTTSSVFLGLSLGCARCHDHKYDPLTCEDYYSLLAVFNGTEKLGLPRKSPEKEKDAVGIQALIETKSEVQPTFLLRRGNPLNRGAEVQPSPPKVLAPTPLRIVPPAPSNPSRTTSGRRLALAQWIGSEHNPLTWRVHANRIWQHAMGKALAATPSDFGFKGSSPSNPALLDFLAAALVQNGGRTKPMLREILLSATYRQSSQHKESAAAIDPENILFWRMNRRRMEAEILRDNILSTAGRLNLQPGGPGVKPRIRPELITASQRNKWPALTHEGPEQWRRSVYIYAKRQLLLPMLELFDAPTTMESSALRTQSVVPTQALVLMNDEFVEEQAAFLAKRACEKDTCVRQTVAQLLHRVLLRAPSETRTGQAFHFVEERINALLAMGTPQETAREQALTDLVHVLLNTSEFLHID